MVSANGEKLSLAVVGLGYVGLPLAVSFAKAGVNVTGFDINEKRIKELKNKIDSTGEVPSEDIKNAEIDYTSDARKLKKTNFIIVAVPTPVNEANQPDLALVESASKLVGQNLSKGAIVVYESTVYPGVTEDICVPIIEKESGLKCGKDWKVGYSPERVNPGDVEHTIERIIKIVSGMDKESLEKIAEVYSIVCKAGVHKAENIKTAETAKVFENIQRDVNISLVNELALICNKIGIKTPEVLAAGGTKWNFLKFKPGLVGGHCIGVDPYYLVYKAEELGYHPQVISAGRRINDSMSQFVADEVIKGMIQANKVIQKTKVLVLGLTFKENIRDRRNSKIIQTIKSLQYFGIKVYGFDPNLTEEEIIGMGVTPTKKIAGKYDAVIASVPHKEFFDLAPIIEKVIEPKAVIMDIPGMFVKEFGRKKQYIYKNL